jgi:hypothetical protein
MEKQLKLQSKCFNYQRCNKMLSKRFWMSKRSSQDEVQYKQFLVKWFSKPASKSTWMAEEGLKKAEPELHDESMKVFSPESSFPIRGD